jgi:hypothetical protein
MPLSVHFVTDKTAFNQGIKSSLGLSVRRCVHLHRRREAKTPTHFFPEVGFELFFEPTVISPISP